MASKKIKNESIFGSFTINNIAISTAINCHWSSDVIDQAINQIFKIFVFCL